MNHDTELDDDGTTHQEVKPMDYEKLWKWLKGQLETEAEGYTNAQTDSDLYKRRMRDSSSAQDFLDRMTRAETLAMTREVKIP